VAEILNFENKYTAEEPSTLKVCNALSSLLSNIESGIEAVKRIPEYGSTDVIIKDLEKTRIKINQELTLAIMRHEAP
jgi:hypothetical protein